MRTTLVCLAMGPVLAALTVAPTAGGESGPAPRVVRTDGDGLPLPDGAVVRLGSTRFRHPAPVYHAAWAPDGTALATAAHGCVSVWDAATGRLRRRAEWPGVPFDRVAYSADGSAVYAVVDPYPLKEGCEVITYDPATLKERARGRLADLAYDRSAFSPRADRLVLLSSHPVVAVLFDPAAGKEVARIEPASRLRGGKPQPGERWRPPSFTPDGQQLLLAFGADDFTAYSPADGKALPEPDRDRFDGVCAQVLPNGSVLTVGSTGARRWDPQKAKPVWKTDATGFIDGLEVSADGKWAAFFDRGQATILDTLTGRPTVRTPRTVGGIMTDWRGSLDAVQSVAFKPDGRTLAVTYTAGTVGLWDAATGKPLRQSSDPLMVPNDPRFTLDGRRVLVRQGSATAAWDVAAPGRLTLTNKDIRSLSPDGTTGVRLEYKRPAAFIDAWTGEPKRAFDPPETPDSVSGGIFTADGRRFIGWRMRHEGPNNCMNGFGVWDVATGKRLALYTEDPAANETAGPNGRAIALVRSIGQSRNRLELWEPSTGKVRWSRELDDQGGLFAFSRDGGLLVRRVTYWLEEPQDRKVPPVAARFTVFDARSGDEVLRGDGPPVPPQPPLNVCYPRPFHVPLEWVLSPDGRTVAVSDPSGVRLWELAADRERARFAHAGPVHGLAFDPTGRLLAAAGDADSVLLWDVYGTRTTATRPTAADLHRAWDDLGSPDAAVGFRAIRALASGGPDGLKLLADQVAALPALAPATVDRLVADLDAANYRTRERATATLRASRAEVSRRLAAARASAGPEAVQRIEAILGGPIRYGTGDLRRIRVVEAVEAVGTAKARALLDRWGGGDGLMAEAARAAVRRFDANRKGVAHPSDPALDTFPRR